MIFIFFRKGETDTKSKIEKEREIIKSLPSWQAF
jgi:hypothetical protein